jgi:hypothetical protein
MRTLICLIAIALCVACAHDELQLNERSNAHLGSCVSVPHRTKQDAISIAQCYFDEELQKAESRASKPLSVDYVLSSASRVSLTDTLAYVIQRGEDDGFAVVAYPTYAPDLLAFSSTGHFDYEESEDDPVYAEFISKLPRYYEIITLDTLQMADRSGLMLSSLFVVQDDGKWSQNSPFNYYVDQEHPGYPAGCVAVATGLIMHYCRDTLTYHGEFFDFDKIRRGMLVDTSYVETETTYSRVHAVDRVAKLLYFIGIDVRMRYKDGKSGSTMESAGNLLMKLKYKIKGSYGCYEYFQASIALAIKSGGLVIISGRETTNSHCWIIDGYRYSYPGDAPMPEERQYMQNIYLHCNWGWGGYHNGYYRGDVFAINVSGETYEYTPLEYRIVNTYRELPLIINGKFK